MKQKARAVFIDGSNLYESAKSLGFDTDYKKLLAVLNDEKDLMRAYFFTALPPKEVESPLRGAVDYMQFNGYDVITKETREYTDTVTGKVKVKGNMDMEIGVYAMRMAERVTDIVLFSGDGDFRILVEELKMKGCFVTVVSTIQGSTPMCSELLRREADQFVDLADMRDAIKHDRQ